MDNPQKKHLHTDVNGTLYFDLEGATRRPSQQLPKVFGDKKNDGDKTRVPVKTITEVFSDDWVHPGSGGLIGDRAVAEYLDYSTRHLRRVLSKEPWIRRYGNTIASNVESLDELKRVHNEEDGRKSEAQKKRKKATDYTQP